MPDRFRGKEKEKKYSMHNGKRGEGAKSRFFHQISAVNDSDVYVVIDGGMFFIFFMNSFFSNFEFGSWNVKSCISE